MEGQIARGGPGASESLLDSLLNSFNLSELQFPPL